MADDGDEKEYSEGAPDVPGFLQYKKEHLAKVNALRLANSLVQITGVPILDRGQIGFSSASSAHNEPRSCANCSRFNETAETCQRIGPSVRVKRFVYPPAAEKGSKPIEYWPICDGWEYGEPNRGSAIYKKEGFDDPSDIGLSWVNAPEVGLRRSGTSCGGANDGDDCDLWIIEGDDKRDAKTGFCRVLQSETDNMDCCDAWVDDDILDWRKAQQLMDDLDSKASPRGPNPLLGRKPIK